ncbi:hypothetical protein K438DRAFT_1765580 [Mycena galopus ATCC 62051]|nr:hypothetical protein K438DRAFT_1765580 [Mycena galopus ATCC 62051]
MATSSVHVLAHFVLHRVDLKVEHHGHGGVGTVRILEKWVLEIIISGGNNVMEIIITHKEGADVICTVELRMDPIGVRQCHELGDLAEELGPLFVQTSSRLEVRGLGSTGHGVTTTELRDEDGTGGNSRRSARNTKGSKNDS